MGRNKHFIKPTDLSPAELEIKQALIRSLCQTAIPKLVADFVHKLAEFKGVDGVNLIALWRDYSQLEKQIKQAFLHLKIFSEEEMLILLRGLFSIYLPPLSPEVKPSPEDQLSPDKIKQLLLDLAQHKSLKNYLIEIRAIHPDLIKDLLASLTEKPVKYLPTENDLSKNVRITSFYKQKESV
jgi:hypothetical protein